MSDADLPATLARDSANLLRLDGIASDAVAGSSGRAGGGQSQPPAAPWTGSPMQSSTGWFDSAQVDLDQVLPALSGTPGSRTGSMGQSTSSNNLSVAQSQALTDIADEGQTDFASNALLFVTTPAGSSLRGFSTMPVFVLGAAEDQYAGWLPPSLSSSQQVADRFPTSGLDVTALQADQVLGVNQVPSGVQEMPGALVGYDDPVLISCAPSGLNGVRQLSLVAQQVLAPNGDVGFEYLTPVATNQPPPVAADPSLVTTWMGIDASQSLSFDYPALSRVPMSLMLAQATLASVSQAFSQSSYEFLYEAGQFATQVGASLPAHFFDLVAGVESALRQLAEQVGHIADVVVTACQEMAQIEYGITPTTAAYSPATAFGAMPDPIVNAGYASPSAASFSYGNGRATLTAAGATRLMGWAVTAWNETNTNQAEANFFLAYANAVNHLAGALDNVHDELTIGAQEPIGGALRPPTFPAGEAGLSAFLQPAAGCWTGMMADSTLQLIDNTCASVAQLADNLRKLGTQLQEIGEELIPDPSAWWQGVMMWLIDIDMILLGVALTAVMMPIAAAAGSVLGEAWSGLLAAEVVPEVAADSEGAAEAVTTLAELGDTTLESTDTLATDIESFNPELVSPDSPETWFQYTGEDLMRTIASGSVKGIFNSGSSLAGVALQGEIDAAVTGHPYDPSATAWWQFAIAQFGGTLLASVASSLLKGVSAISRLLDKTVADLLPADIASRPALASGFSTWVNALQPFDIVLKGTSTAASSWFSMAISEVISVATGDPRLSFDGVRAAIITAYRFAYGALVGLVSPLGPQRDRWSAEEFPKLASQAAANQNSFAGLVWNTFQWSKGLEEMFPVQNAVGQALKQWLTSAAVVNTLLTASRTDWLPAANGTRADSTAVDQTQTQAIADLIDALPDSTESAPSDAEQQLFDYLATTNPDFVTFLAQQHAAAAAQGKADPLAACIQKLRADPVRGAAFTAALGAALADPFGDYATIAKSVLDSNEAKLELVSDIALWTGTGDLYQGVPFADAIATTSLTDLWSAWVAAMAAFAGSDVARIRTYKWALMCWATSTPQTEPDEVLASVRGVDAILAANGWASANTTAALAPSRAWQMPQTDPALVDTLLATFVP